MLKNMARPSCSVIKFIGFEANSIYKPHLCVIWSFISLGPHNSSVVIFNLQWVKQPFPGELLDCGLLWVRVVYFVLLLHSSTDSAFPYVCWGRIPISFSGSETVASLGHRVSTAAPALPETCPEGGVGPELRQPWAGAGMRKNQRGLGAGPALPGSLLYVSKPQLQPLHRLIQSGVFIHLLSFLQKWHLFYFALEKPLIQTIWY